MATDSIIHDRGRGPEIAGTRITVYNLLPHFLDPAATEAEIGRLYELTPEQISAARAYVLSHPETVLAGHLGIEAKLAAGNPPEVIEQAKRTHEVFLNFKDWLAGRRQDSGREGDAESTSGNGPADSGRVPTFREWLAERDSRPGEGP